MKKTLSVLMISSILFGGIISAHGAEINGEDSASITVNGTLGQDNEDENGPNIEEGSKDWINVTLDTANIFYTTKESNHADITSPEYKITNNSGRGVKITVNDFSLNSGNLDNVDSLSISSKDTFDGAKSVDLKAFNGGEFITLGNNQGKLDVEADGFSTYKNETTYIYSGKTKSDYYKSKAEKTTHTLTLGFEALDKNGHSVVAP